MSTISYEPDNCQPVYISTESDVHIFILIIEDRKLLLARDTKRFYTSQNWVMPAPVLDYFDSPLEAYKHAMKNFPEDKWKINSITSLGMNNFLSNDDLEENMSLQ